MNLANIKEDRDVVEPFVERLLLRLREKHPELELTTDDLSVVIEVRPRRGYSLAATSIRIRRMLSDMEKEGICF